MLTRQNLVTLAQLSSTNLPGLAASLLRSFTGSPAVNADRIKRHTVLHYYTARVTFTFYTHTRARAYVKTHAQTHVRTFKQMKLQSLSPRRWLRRSAITVTNQV